MFRILVAAGVLIPLLLACAPSVMPVGNERQPIVVTELNDGKVVELAMGDMLAVELSAIPGTGYSWAPSTGADAVLVQMEPKVEFRPKPQETSERRVGAAETQVLRFQARKQGITDLVVDYRRPWEKSTPPERRFHLKVVVR